MKSYFLSDANPGPCEKVHPPSQNMSLADPMSPTVTHGDKQEAYILRQL